MLCLLMSTSLAAFSQQNAAEDDALSARKVFEKIQSPALETLRQSTRLDMLDYWDADSVFKAKNEVKGESWLLDVSPRYLKVQVSPVSTYEIKLLPAKKGDMVMTVYTVGSDTQARDSRVDFYDASLSPLDAAKYFKTPRLKDFFEIPKNADVNMADIAEVIPFKTVEYTVSPDEDVITARLTVATFLSEENRKLIEKYLKPGIKINLK